MKIKLSLLFFVFCGFEVKALVDTKNANYTKTFVDISIPGSGLPLLVERTYNSRSLYRGMFGYGWCSNLETRLEVMPDNTLMIVECGGGLEIPYVSNMSKGSRQALIQRIMAEVKKKKGLSKKYVSQVERDLKKSPLLQSELIRAFRLRGKAKAGETYRAVGRQGDYIQFTGSQYRRTLPNSQVQIFDQTGALIQEQDKSGNWIKIRRKKGKIVKVMDNKGRSLSFRRKKGVLTITGPNGLKASYTIEGDNLLSVVNSKGEKYVHLYDSNHNLIKTRYPDGTYESLSYNKNRDWVMSFKDRRGCKERYKYVTNKRNKDHYWTDVRKICGKRVTNISRYEFWNRKKPDGSKYLYRARQKVNGLVADITYDGKTGSPLSVTRNRITTRYAYYGNGFLKSRLDPGRKVTFSKYNNKCKKPTQVLVQYIQNKKPVRKVQTQISYDAKKCHLTMAKQSGTGRWVVVKRDHLGRISEMRDQSKKRIIVAYDERYSKPKKITRPGVGSIQVFYNKAGQVDTGKTRTDPTVAAQVASVFNGFLEIISPVARNINI